MKNIILISFDTLRADVAYSGKFPTIENLRNNGITFTNTISSSPLTPISHATVFTGLQPPHHGIRHLFKERLNPNIPTLANILRKHGYKTSAIVSCPGLNKWYNLNTGFSFYDDEIPLLPDGTNPLDSVDVSVRGTALKRAPEVITRALDWLTKNKNEKFFLFMHFFDSHWPYEPPEKLIDTNPYEGEVAYMDYYLGKFFERLKEIDYDTKDDLILLFSDHGEDLGGWYPNDHGGEKLGHPEEKGHGCLLYDTTQLVPLIINHPIISSQKGLQLDQQVRLVDIMPTILQLLNISIDQKYMDGISLVNTFDNNNIISASQNIAYCETFYLNELKNINAKFNKLTPLKAVRIGNKNKIIWSIGNDKIEAYNLSSDPYELVPLKNIL